MKLNAFLLAIISIVTTFIFFQNCSKVKFEEGKELSSEFIQSCGVANSPPCPAKSCQITSVGGLDGSNVVYDGQTVRSRFLKQILPSNQSCDKIRWTCVSGKLYMNDQAGTLLVDNKFQLENSSQIKTFSQCSQPNCNVNFKYENHTNSNSTLTVAWNVNGTIPKEQVKISCNFFDVASNSNKTLQTSVADLGKELKDSFAGLPVEIEMNNCEFKLHDDDNAIINSCSTPEPSKVCVAKFSGVTESQATFDFKVKNETSLAQFSANNQARQTINESTGREGHIPVSSDLSMKIFIDGGLAPNGLQCGDSFATTRPTCPATAVIEGSSERLNVYAHGQSCLCDGNLEYDKNRGVCKKECGLEFPYLSGGKCWKCQPMGITLNGQSSRDLQPGHFDPQSSICLYSGIATISSLTKNAKVVIHMDSNISESIRDFQAEPYSMLIPLDGAKQDIKFISNPSLTSLKKMYSLLTQFPFNIDSNIDSFQFTASSNEGTTIPSAQYLRIMATTKKDCTDVEPKTLENGCLIERYYATGAGGGSGNGPSTANGGGANSR